MAGFNLQGGFGAGGGADILQQILKQKALEFAQAEQIRMAQARLAEDARQSNQQNVTANRGQDVTSRGQDLAHEVGMGNLGVAQRHAGVAEGSLAQRKNEFEAEGPQRLANVRLLGAQAGDVERRPQAEAENRSFVTGRDRTQHGYQLGEIGAQGNEQRKTLEMRAAGDPQAAASQVNEILDAKQLIESLATDPALPRAVGPVDQFNVAAYAQDPRNSADINRVAGKHDQLVGIIQLAQGGKLKGQGPVSDIERKMLANAASRLRRGLSEEEYKTILSGLNDYFTRKLEGSVRPLDASKPVKFGEQPAAPAKVGRFEIIR